MENFVKYCKDYIVDHISDYVGDNVYFCELGYTITEGPNCDGTLTYSTYEAKEYLREWWDDCASYWEYEKVNFGENMHNPFENPEAYMVCMVIEGVNAILGRCPIVDERWSEECELTQEDVDKIIEFVESFDEDEELF